MEIVTVVFSRRGVFSFQNLSPEIDCILKHIPQGEGDHYHFEYQGIEFTVNPLTTEFVGIVYHKKDKEVSDVLR